MGIPVTVIVPETTSPYMRQKIVDFGAELEAFGSAWDDANEKGTKSLFHSTQHVSSSQDCRNSRLCLYSSI